MNIYLKNFLHRGLIFGGFGPIILSIVYAFLENSIPDFSLSGTQVLLAIVSTYFLAFLQAGASVFNQIENWTVPKALLCHFTTIYLAYSICYIINTWIPFEPMVLAIFTAIFVVIYFIIWITVFLSVKAVSRKFNSKLV